VIIEKAQRGHTDYVVDALTLFLGMSCCESLHIVLLASSTNRVCVCFRPGSSVYSHRHHLGKGQEEEEERQVSVSWRAQHNVLLCLLCYGRCGL
jgi:hypothetical protein